ncbi:hypothetical protein BH23ACT11_BH23ACT11_25580 [soil metagenome]
MDNEDGAAPEIPHSVIVIQNPTNEGFARACNQGIAASDGELVVLINPDSLVDHDFFASLEDFFEGNPKAGIAGPRIVDASGTLQLSARREVSFVSGLLGRTSFLTRLFPSSAAVKNLFPAAGSHDEPAEVDWISGACMAVRREALETAGALDERFFMYFEDADLCRRARGSGWPVYYVPQVEVLHLTGASSRSKATAIWRLHKSAFLYHRKHGRHGPLGLYSGLVLLGLCARAVVKSVIVVSHQVSAISKKQFG